MGVFEFVVVLVVVSTIGKVVTAFADQRALPPTGGSTAGSEIESLRESVADLGTRLHRLEQERDFYKELLEAPRAARTIGAGSEVPSDGGTPPPIP